MLKNDVLARYLCYVEAKRPEITVFMTVHNREKYICEAIDSILNNTLKNYYFIFIDNCSTDNTSILITEYVKNNDNLGYIYRESTCDYPNFQYAVDICLTDYFMVLHDDDIVHENLLEVMLKSIKKLECVAVSSSKQNIDANGYKMPTLDNVHKVVLFKQDDYLLNYLQLNRVTMCCPSTIYYKPFLKEKKIKWNPNVGPCVDDYFYFQICRYSGTLAIIPEILINYRIHSGQDSSISKAFMYMKLYDFLLDDEYYRNVLINNPTRIRKDTWFSFKHLFNAYNNKAITKEEYYKFFDYKCLKMKTDFKSKALWVVMKYIYSHNFLFCLLLKLKRMVFK